MLSEWDEAKRLSNLIKHRLDFLDAWLIFEGPFIVEAARRQGEERKLAVG
ncbi:BrnT family toxin [Sabulicella glaciei]|uniref:BrnT family toxin n=1 Tax=Sabulicella glaciei TaxID=2984948 RepID=A0ABT3P1C4_9PROT|nr:BrnT family toxin [Roseococcus sp. MDT2-1-1]MCW8088230.1 BrnT family toxin [Roseococcus sp. MDT2-1-1]